MSIESKLSGFERDAERGEKLREKIGGRLANLNRDLTRDISEMVRVMFTSDKQFERALIKRLDKAATSDKEFILTQGGQRFKVSDIDPKRVIKQRELTSFEKGKLDKLRDTLGEIETHAKSALRAVRLERVLLNQFAKDSRVIASELRGKLRGSEDTEKRTDLERQIKDFETKAGRISAAESSLADIQKKALKLVQTAKAGQRVIDGVTKRADLEGILVSAAGGFGVSAAVAALVGSMGAAGILALPALIAFALSRIVRLIKDVAGDD